MKKISIIMPVYNGEGYLREAIESIRKQTMTDFELICIDDASTDNTEEMLSGFAKADSRIRIIKNNHRMGAAYSRNNGIWLAEGEYLLFLDSDDLFEEDLLKRAFATAVLKDADIVMYHYIHFPDGKFPENHTISISENMRRKYCRNTFSIKEFPPIEWMYWGSGLCNKIYRRDFILQNQLEFQNLASANDVFFVDMAIMLTGKLVYLDDERIFLFARDHKKPSRISSYRDPICICEVYEKEAEELKKRGLWEEMLPYFSIRFLLNMCAAFRKCHDKERNQEVYTLLREKYIKSIGIKEAKGFALLDEPVKKRITFIGETADVTKWCGTVNQMEIILESNAPKMKKLFEKNGKGTAVWGAGDYGKTIVRFCNDHSLEVTAVIDKSPEKWGRYIEGKRVCKFEDAADNLSMILAATSNYYLEIKKYVEGVHREIAVVDLKDYLINTSDEE